MSADGGKPGRCSSGTERGGHSVEASGSPQVLHETEDLHIQSFTLEHQLNESKHPEVALHSCRRCASIVVDARHSTEGRALNVRWKPGDETKDSSLTSDWGTAAAREGCALFASLGRGLFFNPMSSDTDNAIYAEFSGQNGQAKITLWEHNLGRGSHDVTVKDCLGSFELYTIPGKALIDGFLGQQLSPNLVPDSWLSFTRARRLLDDCCANHAQCKSFNLAYMPTRVLEILPISDFSSTSSFRVRLLENPELSPYVTLSYCWGGDQLFKTTKKRLPDYKREVQLEALAQTIRDALVVTHGIGVRYLWVDALCIVQDSNDDKMKEISNMHRIYRGSLFTIAAAVAQTSRHGFLQPRAAYRGFKVKTQIGDNLVVEAAAVPDRTNHERNAYPIYTRGWTFQEGLLSTRVLAYGNRGMVYACLESQRCDGGYQQSIGGLHSSDYDAIRAIFKHLSPGSQHLGSEKHPMAWGAVVSAYTQRQLSFADDKLLAITAIAEEYLRTKPVTLYLGGMWKEDLLHQCLWSRARPTSDSRPITRPAAYRAPSWSWASLDGHFVTFQQVDGTGSLVECNFSCKLIDAQTVLCDETSPFGPITGGFIRLRGKMRRLTWLSPGNSNSPSDGCGWACEDPEGRWNDQGAGPGDDRLDFNIDIVKEWPPMTRITLWCIEICTFVAPGNVMNLVQKRLFDERGSARIVEGRGLLLEPVSSEVADEARFRRVGMISFEGLPKGDSHYDRRPYWFDHGEFEWREVVIV